MVVNVTKLPAIMNPGVRMLKPFTLTALLMTCLGASTAYADNLKGDSAVLRALDKVTATTRDYTVPVGDTLKYGSLEIKVQHCEKRPPEETPEVFVFLQVREPGKAEIATGRAENRTEMDPDNVDPDPEKLFSGWMFASSPALSALEHPVYDIWVLDCNVPNRS